MFRFFLILSIISFAENSIAKINTTINYRKFIYKISTVDSSFEKTENVKGTFKEEKYTAKIYFGELERVVGINAVSFDEKNKLKKIKKDKIYKSDELSSSFFDGYKSQKIEYEKTKKSPENLKFEYSVTLKNTELMCLSKIDFYEFDKEKVDTIYHEVHVPNGFLFLINKTDLEKNNKVKIDSIKNSIETIYTFLLVTANLRKSKFEPVDYFGIRVLVYPENTNPYTYFNNWYQDLIQNIPHSQAYQKVCDSLTKSLPNKDSIIKVIFKYVCNKIRYIDIENGINAFKPRQSDEVLHKMQGDCKDMAFLLYNMLTYKGIEANLALNSTLDNDFLFDFPTLSSANHVICIASTNNKKYYLDATESLSEYNIPSRQIQGTLAFITKRNSFDIISIPIMAPDYNENNNSYKLEYTGKEIKGTFKSTYKGFSKMYIETITKQFSTSKIKQLLVKHYQDQNFNATYNNIVYSNQNDAVVVSGDISLNVGVMTKVEDKIFFNFNFCPFVHSHDVIIDTSNAFSLYTTNKLVNKIEIEMPFEIKKVESQLNNITIDKSFNYQFKISHKKNLLVIEYVYVNPFVKITKEQTKEYNLTNQLIKNSLNHEIIIY